MTKYDYYVTEEGKSPFAKWLLSLDPVAASKVNTALERIEANNPGDVSSVGGGVFERRIRFRPGYRIYFGEDSDKLVILLGGTKRRQSEDIKQAKKFWNSYKNQNN